MLKVNVLLHALNCFETSSSLNEPFIHNKFKVSKAMMCLDLSMPPLPQLRCSQRKN